MRSSPRELEARPRGRDRVPGLDGLRGLAIALVLLTHVVGTDGAGLVGVLVFFVLSGYLITWLLLKEYEQAGAICLSAFYWRRAVRLLPGLTLFLVVFVLVTVTVDVGVSGMDALRGAVLGLTYVTDFALALQVGYVPELAHLWSLAVEEQFYLLWPLSLLVLLRRRAWDQRRKVFLAAIVGAGALRIVTLALAPSLGLFVYALPTTWVDALLVGAFCAVVRTSRSTEWRRINVLVKRSEVLVLTLVVVAGFALTPGSYRWAGTYLVGIPLLAAAVGVLILGMADGQTPRTVAFLASRPARLLGQISYSLYLYNSTCIMLLQRVYGTGLAPRAAGLVLAVILAFLSYRFVERPILAMLSGRVVRRGKPSTTSGPTVHSAAVMEPANVALGAPMADQRGDLSST
jgi:peptidoglycan/LPS O-acetylase OafA/YrhL